MDFKDLHIRVNIKSICYFEKITKKSFFSIMTDDIPMLAYCCFVVNNPGNLVSFDAFLIMLKNKKIAKWLFDSINKEFEHIMQFNAKGITDGEEKEGEEAPSMKMSDIASSLIVRLKMDAHYVMYEMDLWEIQSYFEQWDGMQKSELVDKRFWTYLQIAPHIDSKKIKSPESLVPFKWEEEEIKAKKEQDLKNNMYAMKHTIGMQLPFIKDKEEENG